MTGPSRRDALLGATVIGAELAPFLRPAKAAPAAEVGPIEAGYADYVVLAKAHDAVCAVTWKAEERFDEPERPGWNPIFHEGGHKVVETVNGKRRCCLDDSAENVARLRLIIEQPEAVFSSYGWEPEMYPPRVESARRTLDAILAWQAEHRRRADEAGLTAAQEIEERACAAATAKARELLVMEPTSLREAAFQAAIIEAGTYDDERDPDWFVTRLVEIVGIKLYWRDEGIS